MKLIVLRGLPGSGKTELADRLAAEFGASVLHVDYFKTQIRKDFPDQFSWPEVRAKAYDEALRYLAEEEKKGTPIIICEELFRDKDFVERLMNFCQENGVETKWFRIERGLEKLMELEQSPARVKRPIHNSREDFEMLDKEIKDIIISGEEVVDNNGELEESLNEIREAIKSGFLPNEPGLEIGGLH